MLIPESRKPKKGTPPIYKEPPERWGEFYIALTCPPRRICGLPLCFVGPSQFPNTGGRDGMGRGGKKEKRKKVTPSKSYSSQPIPGRKGRPGRGGKKRGGKFPKSYHITFGGAAPARPTELLLFPGFHSGRSISSPSPLRRVRQALRAPVNDLPSFPALLSSLRSVDRAPTFCLHYHH